MSDRIKTLGCSAASGGIGAFVTSPIECLRVRFQVEPAATRPSAILAFGTQIVQKEGFLHGLFLPGNAAWSASMASAFGLRMMLYDPLRTAIDGFVGGGGSANAFAAGVCTGCMTNALSCPLFNAKSASAQRLRPPQNARVCSARGLPVPCESVCLLTLRCRPVVRLSLLRSPPAIVRRRGL